MENVRGGLRNILEADDGVAKSNGGDIRGTWLNLCVAPFLNVCVPNLPQGVKDRECWRWLESGRRCCPSVRRREN